jgi:uncharacterized protein YijF (DUF1287 family)
MSKRVRALVLAVGAFLVVAALVVAVMWLKSNVFGETSVHGGAAVATSSTTGTNNDGTVATPMKPLLKSSIDQNGNGVDDYTDLVAGARIVAKEHPAYDDGYYQGGYPPDGKGACTDLVASAFKTAGYDLKAMVDADIAAHPADYPGVSAPDPNIDYRRTGTLDQFFKLHAVSLTTNVNVTDQWQQGDIVVFENTRHIGMVGDTRDAEGISYIIHNNRQSGPFEEDYLAHAKRYKVTGHYRFDVSKIPASVIKKS